MLSFQLSLDFYFVMQWIFARLDTTFSWFDVCSRLTFGMIRADINTKEDRYLKSIGQTVW